MAPASLDPQIPALPAAPEPLVCDAPEPEAPSPAALGGADRKKMLPSSSSQAWQLGFSFCSCKQRQSQGVREGGGGRGKEAGSTGWGGALGEMASLLRPLAPGDPARGTRAGPAPTSSRGAPPREKPAPPSRSLRLCQHLRGGGGGFESDPPSLPTGMGRALDCDQ